MTFAHFSEKHRVILLGANDIRNLPRMDWLVKGILPSTGIAAIYGPPSSGKSFVALDLALTIAAGGTWCNAKVTPNPVVYFWLEGAAGLRNRLEAWGQKRTQAIHSNFNFSIEPFDLNDDALLAELSQQIPKGTVIFFDTLSKAAGSFEENSSADMGKVIGQLRKLQALTWGLIVLIHHTGKSDNAGLRGHSILHGAMDSEILVKREKSCRTWKIVKQRDGQDGASYNFDLSVVDLGVDSDGQPLTSCCFEAMTAVVREGGVKPQGKNQKIVWAAIDQLVETKEKSAVDSSEYDTRVELEKAVNAAAQNLDCPREKRNNVARNVIESLIKRGALQSEEGWLWKRKNR